LVVVGEEASGRVNGTGDPFSKDVGRSSKNGFLMSFGAETHSSSNSYDDRKKPNSMCELLILEQNRTQTKVSTIVSS
jgi:hypothetical protein